ncbi:MAG: type II secretion system protein GspG [Phycisphaerales bacterium]|nr:type II secretion system protein GspG [Phycisphaerales bacterium]
MGSAGLSARASTSWPRRGSGRSWGGSRFTTWTRAAWPDLDAGLRVLAEAAPTSAYYLAADSLLDPWERAYVYIAPGPEGHPYEVVSYGADGQPGGEGENADLSSVRLRGTK